MIPDVIGAKGCGGSQRRGDVEDEAGLLVGLEGVDGDEREGGDGDTASLASRPIGGERRR